MITPHGSVLDVASGGGRHTRFLLERGHAVTAVDRDLSALAALGDTPRLEAVSADLEAGPWPFAGRRFDGIVVTNFLHRPLFENLAASLESGGTLIYETFAQGNERFGKPSNPHFLLEPGELLRRLGETLTVVAFEQGVVNRPRPAVVQRICAVNCASGAPPPPLPAG